MKELPNRKKLRLNGYDYSGEGAYFITICTSKKQCILSKIVGTDAHIGPEIKLSRCGETVKKYIERIPEIDSYVIMPNHIHLIIIKSKKSGPMWASVPTTISSVIRSFKTLVTKETGKFFWQSKFYDLIIRSEKDYLIHLQYIEENPYKWNTDEYYIND